MSRFSSGSQGGFMRRGKLSVEVRPIPPRLWAIMLVSLCVALLSGAARFVHSGSGSPAWLDVVFIVSTAIALTLAVAHLGWRISNSGRAELSGDLLEPRPTPRDRSGTRAPKRRDAE